MGRFAKKIRFGNDYWRRLRDWQKLGIWERIWRKLLQLLDEQEKLDLSQVYLDGSFVAAKQGGNEIGITKIGKGSKIMLVVERNGLPIGLHVASAQPHELKLEEKVLSTIRIPRKRGRPKKRIFELVADRAYHSQEFRRFLRKRGIKVTIPVKNLSKFSFIYMLFIFSSLTLRLSSSISS